MSNIELWADVLPVDGLYGHIKHPHLGLVHLHGNHHFMWLCTTLQFHAALQGHSLHKTQTGHRPEQRPVVKSIYTACGQHCNLLCMGI